MQIQTYFRKKSTALRLKQRQQVTRKCLLSTAVPLVSKAFKKSLHAYDCFRNDLFPLCPFPYLTMRSVRFEIQINSSRVDLLHIVRATKIPPAEILSQSNMTFLRKEKSDA